MATKYDWHDGHGKVHSRPRRRSSNPSNLTLAEAMADLNVGPQVTEIKGLFDQAKSQYREDVGSAHAGGESARAFANVERPKVVKQYDDVASGVAASNQTADAAFGNADATDPFKAALLRERATAARQDEETKARSLQGLSERVLQSTAGEQYAINNARGEYGKTRDTLSSKLQDLLGQRGKLVTTELGKLNAADEAASTKASEKGGEIYGAGSAFEGKTHAEVAALSPEERARIVAEFNKNKNKKDGDKPGGVKRATPDKIEALTSDFSEAVSQIHRFISAHTTKDKKTGKVTTPSRSAVATALVQGIPDVKDTLGTVTEPGYPKIRQFPVSLALDMVFGEGPNRQHISAANSKRLHSLGYKITDLPGAVSLTDWVRKHQLNRPGQQPTGATGGSPYS